MVRRFSFIPGMAEHLRGTVVDAGEDERPLVSGNQVVVGNAPAATSPEGIREFFRSCGEVIGLRQLDGGDLLLTFQDEDGVSTALMEDGVEYKGAQLTVSKAERKTGLIQGRTVSMISSVLNLLNAIVGAGTLCMAYTMQGSGIVLFLILLFVMVLIIDYSLQMMLAAASTTLVKGQMVSYERLGALAWGEKGRILVSGMILLQNTGAMVTYFKVFKDVIPDIMVLVVNNPDSHFRDANFMTSLAAAIVFFPACSPTVGMLSYVGMCATHARTHALTRTHCPTTHRCRRHLPDRLLRRVCDDQVPRTVPVRDLCLPHGSQHVGALSRHRRRPELLQVRIQDVCAQHPDLPRTADDQLRLRVPHLRAACLPRTAARGRDGPHEALEEADHESGALGADHRLHLLLACGYLRLPDLP